MTTDQPRHRRQDAYLWWNAGTQALELKAMWWTGDGATFPVNISWGDGERQTVNANAVTTHNYAHTGAYRVHMWAATSGDLLGIAQIVVRTGKPEPAAALDPDDPSTVVVDFPTTLDETGILALYRVHWSWPDQTLFDDVWGVPGASARRSLGSGAHRVRVRDEGTRWITEVPVTVPSPSLNCDLATGPGPRDVRLTVTAAEQGRPLVVAWGDITPTEPVSGTSATHTYPPGVDGVWLVQLWYADASGLITKTVATSGGSS